MSGEGSKGNREVPLTSRPMEEGGSWGKAGRGQPTRGRCPRTRGKAPREKHGFPHGSEPQASDPSSERVLDDCLEELLALTVRVVVVADPGPEIAEPVGEVHMLLVDPCT